MAPCVCLVLNVSELTGFWFQGHLTN